MDSVLIAYASETGTAQDTAESLWRDAKYRRLQARVLSLGDLDIQELCAERCVVLVVATSGQGEMPSAVKSVWTKLCLKTLPCNLFSKMHLAVIALGDSSYLKYNFAGKKMFRRLCQLGALPLVDLALADDQHELGIDAALYPFRDALFAAIYRLALFQGMQLEADESECLPPRYTLLYNTTNGPSSSTDFRVACVHSSTRLTANDHFQHTRLLSLSLEQAVSYHPGDVLLVHPFNIQQSLDITIKALGYTDSQLDCALSALPNDTYTRALPDWLMNDTPTLRKCLLRYLDLQMVPRRSFFRLLAQLATHPLEKERLQELASPQGLDDYLDYCVRPKRSIAETLRDFGETARRLEPERLFDVIPAIRARAFSIASSPTTHPHIDLVVAQVEYKTKLQEDRRGLCSTFLCRLQPTDTLLVTLRAGTFRWPSVETPLVLVAPGTGVAPFRSLLHYRHNIPHAGLALLFFGCRHRNKDFYFEHEWSQLEHCQLIPAFSRQHPHNKVYVQHNIALHASRVWDVVHNQRGSIFIAGRADDMPNAVMDQLRQIATDRGLDGTTYMATLQSHDRVQFETWT